MSIEKPNKEVVSVCGLFCKSCGVYYATVENDVKKLQEIADKLGQNVNETYCNGCRSERKSASCQNCYISDCATVINIDFCVECNEYPCKELQDFQSKMPHRKNLWNSQSRIKQVGWEKWHDEMVEYYSCSKCNTLNGAYDISCRKCGNSPSNQFVKDHMI